MEILPSDYQNIELSRYEKMFVRHAISTNGYGFLLLNVNPTMSENESMNVVISSRGVVFFKFFSDFSDATLFSATKDSYLSHKASIHAQMQELTEKMEQLEKSSQDTSEQGGAFIDKYSEYTELETLTTEVARDVVKRVTVYKDGGIEIELALRDELEELLNCIEIADAAS